MQDDTSRTLFGECRHSGLLWALESVAWSSEYFAGAVSVLTDLAKIDPGGRWSNRATESLKEIFLPGFPQTHASPKERLAAFDIIVERDPKTAWAFAGGYYSQGHFSESHRFRWRDAGGERRGLEREKTEDYQEYLGGFLPKLCDLACASANLVSSINAFTRLPADVRERLLAELEKIEPTNFSKDERTQMLKEIREALNWISTYGDEDRRANIPALSRVLEKFEPEDVLERVGWLLSDPWPRLPGGEPTNYEEKDAAVLRAQEEAARKVLDKVPIAKVVDYAMKIQYVGVFGHALGKAVRDQEEDAAVLDSMLQRLTETPGLVTGYALGRIEATDQGWVMRQIERLKTLQKYSPEGCALLYLALPEGAEIWSAVSSYGKDVEGAYWRRAHGRSRSNKTDTAPIAIEKLLEAQRPAVALEIAGDPQVSIPSSLLKRLIQEFLSTALSEGEFRAGAMTDFYLGHIFKQLHERNELPIEEIAQLEWPFAPVFDQLQRYTSSPLAIHRVLQKDPSIFAQLIGLMYKRDDHSPDPADEIINEKGRENLAHNARQVMNSWRLLPGLRDAGSIDEKNLTEWVEAARQKCAATGHITGGDLSIAFMLAHAPGDADGNWPHTAVRNLIERLNNDLIDEHIQMEIYNSRGVVARGLADGGAQERELADNYRRMSDAVKLKWPRTAAMLRSIANSYMRYAEHEDISSELTDLRWN
jgi:hypothetical protein